MLKKINKSTEFIVVDRFGKPIVKEIHEGGLTMAETRLIANAPISVLLPDEPIILIDWDIELSKIPTIEQLRTPVIYNGKAYRGDYSWGSGVKRGYTLGLTRDILFDTGLNKTEERNVYGGRALTANCLYGAGVGDLRIKYVKAGQLFNGLPIEDGFGYIKRSVAESIRNTEQPKIVLNQSQSSFHFTQRLTWNAALKNEMLPHITGLLDLIHRGGKALEKHYVSSYELQSELIALDADMEEHPFVANAKSRESGKWLARVATTVPVPAVYRLAVPTTCKTIAANGPLIITRDPQDAWGSSQAVNMKNADKHEIDRIASMEVAQYTITSFDSKVFMKGDFGIVDDALLEDYDIVACVEDRKMSARKLETMNLVNAFIGFTMWFAAGSSIGLNAKFFEEMGGDFDGDGVSVKDCVQFPVLWSQVAAYPQQASLKLFKTHTPIKVGGDNAGRCQRIINSMLNIVGMATNIMAATFTMADRARFSRQIGYSSLAALDAVLNYLIKAGTDLFKTNIDSGEVLKQMARLQSAIMGVTGGIPAWCAWPNDAAFTHMIPSELSDAQKLTYEKGDHVREESFSASWDGTVAQILRITLPGMKDVMNGQFAAHPLSYFRDWAPIVSDQLLGHMKEVQTRYNIRVSSTNFSDPDSALTLKNYLRKDIAEVIEQSGCSREHAAAALWRAAHDVRSRFAGAGSVFSAFPDECKAIITHKPGINGNAVIGVLIGIDKNLAKTFKASGDVRQYRQSLGNKRSVLRTALFISDRQIGVFASDHPSPLVGKYEVELKPRSTSSVWALCIKA